MVESVCKIGIEITTILTDQDGLQREHKVTLEGAPFIEAKHVWDQEYFENHLADDWVLKLNDENVPWLTSPAAKPHLVDWIAYILDVPQTAQ